MGQDLRTVRGNFGGCPAHRKTLGITAAALYAAKKLIMAITGLRLPAAMLLTGQCLIALPPREKPASHAMWPNVGFFDHLSSVESVCSTKKLAIRRWFYSGLTIGHAEVHVYSLSLKLEALF